MLVFGDRVRLCAPGVELQAIIESLSELQRIPAGIERHSLLVSLLIASGELVQAVADHAMRESGRDGRHASVDALMALSLSLARTVWRSHLSGYRAPAIRAALSNDGFGDVLSCAAKVPLPDRVLAKAPEGFAEYALYVEEYGAAAAAAFSGGMAPLVIGIRSIGTALAAMVAAGAGGETEGRCPLTVRPVGHPFARTLALSSGVEHEIARAHQGAIAIADEGPGLSGSSFAAVLDALACAGVAESRVHVFPSRLGLGPLAAPAVSQKWQAVQRHRLTFDELFLGGRPRASSLRAWTETLTGPQDDSPRDIGGGRWRSLVFDSARHWPPAHTQLERRKFLLRASGRTFLARFVGLGRYGEARFRRAKQLADAGFSPPVLGLCHGFVIQPWIAGAVPLSAGQRIVARPELVARVAAYLTFRASAMPAEPGRGATPRELLEMAVTNAGESLGAPAGESLRRLEDWLPDLERAARPIEIDGRLHAWEWLVLPTGALLKTDAVDHCDAHDLIGCQDVAWDVAGAAIELGLSPEEMLILRRGLAGVGLSIPDFAFTFYSVCYLAFQLGAASMAAQAIQADDASEASRLQCASANYATQLAARIAGGAASAGAP